MCLRLCCAVQLGRGIGAGSPFGVGTGEGPSKGDCPSHKVTIYNHYADETVEVEVPEDRCGSSSTTHRQGTNPTTLSATSMPDVNTREQVHSRHSCHCGYQRTALTAD